MKKNNPIPFTVCIITKNRRKLLQKCISSLVLHGTVPEEIVIVNNNSSDNTPYYLHTLTKKYKNIRHVLEKRRGYPILYNRGLREAKYDWVAFIDDDCIAANGWSLAVQEGIVKYHRAAVLIGRCETVAKNNLWSMTQLALDTCWKERSIVGNSVIDYKVLDNKNIIYNKAFLENKNISYDESRANFLLGSSEDCDLGAQIQKSGGKAYYLPNMRIFHHDATTMKQYVKRSVIRGLGYMSFKLKWNNNYLSREQHELSKPNLSLMRQLFDFKHEYDISVMFFILIVISFIVTMIFLYTLKIPEAILLGLAKRR